MGSFTQNSISCGWWAGSRSGWAVKPGSSGEPALALWSWRSSNALLMTGRGMRHVWELPACWVGSIPGCQRGGPSQNDVMFTIKCISIAIPVLALGSAWCLQEEEIPFYAGSAQGLSCFWSEMEQSSSVLGKGSKQNIAVTQKPSLFVSFGIFSGIKQLQG